MKVRTPSAQLIAAALFLSALLIWAEVGLVYAKTSVMGGAAPQISAASALLLDAASGQVLFAKDPKQPMHPASLAKIMSLLVALDALGVSEEQNETAGQPRGLSLTDQVTVSATAAAMGGSQVYLRENETFRLRQLLQAVAIASANDATVAVAEYIAGTEDALVLEMNARARRLNMLDTHFANTTGLPADPGERESVTTAQDVAAMSLELIRRHPMVLEWTSIRRKVFREDPLFILENTNDLIGRFEGVDGLKTGHLSQVGWHLVATAERGGRRLVALVLGAPSKDARREDAATLLGYGFNSFVEYVPALAGDTVGSVQVKGGRQEIVPVVATRDVKVLILRGHQDQVNRELSQRELQAPLRRGEPAGSVSFKVGDLTLAEVPVAASRDVERASFLALIWRVIRDFFRSLVRLTQ